MKEILKIFFLLLLIALLAVGCQEDDENTCCDPTNPECPNYDPCYNIEPTADFKMRGTSVAFMTPENLQAEWCDTILNSGVEFKAEMENADSYEWYIGTETEPRFGRSFKVSFSDYYQDTLQNLNPDNPDFYLPLDITLIVRNDEGACVNVNDTLLSMTRQLVMTRKVLTAGTFIGRVGGENFDRQVIFWRDGVDLSNPNLEQQYFAEIIGLTDDDTLRLYGLMLSPVSFDILTSYKRTKWEEDFDEWWLGPDGIKIWRQEIITSVGEPDRVELYFERYPEGSSSLEIKSFIGVRVE